MKALVGVIVLMVGMLAIANIAFSDIMARTDAFLFSEPVPCHVYLKRKQLVESRPNYLPGSFFQVQVELLRMEPDVTRIHQAKNFLQGRLDMPENLQIPNFSERINERIKEIEDTYKVLVFRVLETLEGPSPGEKIVISVGPRHISLYRAMIQNGMKRYLIGYKSLDEQTQVVLVETNDLYVRNDGFLTDLKLWVRRLLSECDNV